MEAIDISKDHVTLQWEPPEDDGKAPITEYIVERREKSEKDWHRCGKVPAEGAGPHQLVDEKVVEGKEYYYRVRAVNKAGPGDPCDHGKPVKVKAKPCQFRSMFFSFSSEPNSFRWCHSASVQFTQQL